MRKYIIFLITLFFCLPTEKARANTAVYEAATAGFTQGILMPCYKQFLSDLSMKEPTKYPEVLNKIVIDSKHPFWSQNKECIKEILGLELEDDNRMMSIARIREGDYPKKKGTIYCLTFDNLHIVGGQIFVDCSFYSFYRKRKFSKLVETQLVKARFTLKFSCETNNWLLDSTDYKWLVDKL